MALLQGLRGLFAFEAPLPAPAARCASCRHFRNEALALEQASPGLASLSSGFGAVRSDDGVCGLHGRYLSARASCSQHAPHA
jgi:hypothetical protein